MADGTVRGAYELNAEQPIRQLRSIRDAGAAADVSIRALGGSLDNLASPTRIERVRMVGERISDIGSKARDSVAEVELLDTRLDELSRKTVTPKIDLSGIAATNAALSEIEARLDRLDHRRVSPNISAGGGFSNIAGGGAAAAASPFQALGGFGGMAAGALGLSPGIMGLLGGATSLVGSAGAGLLGAGVVGLGGGAELAVGGAGVALVAKQAAAGIQEITKAQTAYNTAVQTYGRNSAQAATDAKKLHEAMIQNAGAAVAARQITLLQSDFGTASAPARAQINQGVANVAYTLRGALPSLAPDLTMAAGATAGAAGSYARFVTGQQSLAGIGQLSQAFATDLPIAERSLQNITQTFGQLAVASIPFFHEANVWVQHWTAGMATSTQDTAHVQGVMRGLVTDAQHWADLTGSAYHLMRDIFTASAPSGDSMVVQLTHTLDRWDTWIRDNPQKVQTFFSDARHTTSEIASGVSHLVGDFAKVGQLLGPIFDRALQVLNLFSGLGPGGMSAIGAVLLGGYQGVRSRLGGRGPSAGGLLSSFVLGSPGPAARSMGGVGGTSAAGAAAVGSGVTGYLMARGLPIETPHGLYPGATPEAFQSVYGGVEGARYAMPISQLGAVETGFSRLGSVLQGAATGAARFLGPVAVLTGLLGATQPTQGGGISARLQNALSGVSFGILPGYTNPAAAQLASSQSFLQGLSGLAPSRQAQLIGQHVNQLFGPGEATSGTGMVSPQNLQALMTAQASALGQAATTPGGLRALPGQLHAIQVAVSPALSPAARTQFQAQLGSILNQAAQGVGGTAASQWIDALTRGIGSAQNENQVNKAIRQAMSGVGGEISKLGPRGSRVFASNMAEWVAQEERDYPKLRRPLSRFMEQIITDINRMTGHIGTSMQDLQGKIFYINGQILTGTNAIWNGDNGIWASLTNKSNTTLEHLNGTFGQIQQDAINALSGMGFSKAQATQIVHQAVGGGAGAAAAKAAVMTVGTKPLPGQVGLPSPLSPTAPRTLRATGGIIRGEGLLDTVPTPDGGLAAPGEAWIANRHTMHKLDLASIAKFGKTAWQMIQGEQMPHSHPMRGGVGPRYTTGAGGLSAAGPTGYNVAGQHPELHPGIAQAVQDVFNRFPNFTISSTTGGTHVSGSYHYLGEAADLVSDANTMFAASEWIKSSGLARGLTEGIHNPNLAVKYGQIETPPGVFGAVWPEHLSHIHLAVAGALRAGALSGSSMIASMAMPQLHLRHPRSRLGGYVGPMVDAASGIFAQGLERKINSTIGAGGGGAFGVPGNVSGPIASQMAHAAFMLGFNRIGAAGLIGNAFQESSLNPNLNVAGGRGLFSWNPGANPQASQVQLGNVAQQIALAASAIGRGGIAAMNAAGSPAAAAVWFEQNFEHAGIPNMANRISAAQNAYAAGYQYGRAPVRWGGWHAGGLDAVTSGPTLFGAGEGPKPERVRITPAAQPTASPTRSGHQITFHPGSIVVNGGGDPNKIAEAVADKLIEALDGVDHGASDDELLGVGG